MIKFNNETYSIANPEDGCGTLYANSILVSIGVYASENIIVFIDETYENCDVIAALELALDSLDNDDWNISDIVNEEYDELIASGVSSEKAMEEATSECVAINGGEKYITDWFINRVDANLESTAREYCELNEV